MRYLRQPLHISWHITALLLGIVHGVVLSLILPWELFVNIGWVVTSAVLFLSVCKKRARWLLGIALVSGLFLGLWRGSIERQSFAAYHPYYGKIVSLRGLVADDASYSVKGEQRLRLKNITLPETSLPGTVWVSLKLPADVKRGDSVTVSGLLNPGFGSLQGSMYRVDLTKLRRPVPGDVARRVRDWFTSGILIHVHSPEALLGIGFLTGQKSSLPPDLDEKLKIVGLTHVVVASGYNLTILVAAARRCFEGVSKYLSAMVSAGMILAFVLITGLSPSMSRAGLVAGLSLLVWYYGRAIHPLVLLPLAAAITLIINPGYIWGDLGWYLSFTAFIGVIVLAPLFRAYLWGVEAKPGMLKQIITDTFSAQLLTVPIILYVFGTYASYALVANLLVLPFVPLAMLLTFLTGVASLINVWLAGIIAFFAYTLLRTMTWIIEKIADLPGALGMFRIGRITLVATYILIILLILWLARRTKYNFKN